MQIKRGRPRGSFKSTAALKPFEELVKREIRVQIAMKNLTIKQVAYAIDKAGIEESPKGLSAKLKAGTFSAAYYLALIDVIAKL